MDGRGKAEDRSRPEVHIRPYEDHVICTAGASNFGYSANDLMNHLEAQALNSSYKAMAWNYLQLGFPALAWLEKLKRKPLGFRRSNCSIKMLTVKSAAAVLPSLYPIRRHEVVPPSLTFMPECKDGLLTDRKTSEDS